MKVKVLVLQTWFDIAIQYTGNIVNAYAIALANGSRSVTDEITPGEDLVISNELVVFNKETQLFKGRNIAIATGITTGDLEAISPKLGIGTMAIESTFIVG